MSSSVVVVGAGIAGLVCARRLHQAGVPIKILEAASTAGGRIGTDIVEGFHLDRGFQVYFPNYPNARLEFDHNSLNLKPFEPGCLIWDGKKLREVHQENIIQTLLARWISPTDLLRIFQLQRELKEMSDADIWSMKDVTAEDFLASKGVSPQGTDRFMRPFFGGVLLDTSLTASCRPFAFYFKMLSLSPASVPANGMGELTRVVASALPDKVYQFNTEVTSLIRKGGVVTGVKTADGKTVNASHVVLAVDSETNSQLTGHPGLVEYQSCVTVHFSVPVKPLTEACLVANGGGLGRINHVAPMSVVSKSLAPKGKHLVSATLIGNFDGEDDTYLATSAAYELMDWFPGANTKSWTPLRVDRIKKAQISQPVGFMDRRANPAPEPGLIIAGEHVTYAGIDGAVKSGQDAAVAILSERAELASA